MAATLKVYLPAGYEARVTFIIRYETRTFLIGHVGGHRGSPYAKNGETLVFEYGEPPLGGWVGHFKATIYRIDGRVLVATVRSEGENIVIGYGEERYEWDLTPFIPIIPIIPIWTGTITKKELEYDSVRGEIPVY